MRRRNGSESSPGGFTLIELMVVVIILGILAATIIPQFAGRIQDAKVKKAESDIAILGSALEQFFLNMDRYPTTEEGLRVLVTPPAEGGKRWRGPYIKEVKLDPWDHAYQYRSPGTHGIIKTYDLWSGGADGADGGEGINADVTSWGGS
jgi:general secretion pathway protein G